MNSIERISATLQGRPTDRRAVCPVLSLYGARLTDCALHDYFTDPATYARGQSAVRETFEPDVLLGPFSLPLEGAAFGGRVRFFDAAAPNLARPAISSAGEIDQLEIPAVDSHPRLDYFRQSIRRMAQEHGDEVPIAAIVAGPIDLPAILLGIEGWLETILTDESATRRMLDISVAHFVQWANALVSDGASFVVFPAAFASPRIVTRQIATELTIPAMRRAVAELDGPAVVQSGGVPLAPYLDMFGELPNVPGFILNGADSFAEARQKVGPEPVLFGNVEGPSLFLRRREDIEADCLAALDDRRDDPRFVLATSMADIDLKTPPENIHVFRQTAEAFAGECAV